MIKLTSVFSNREIFVNPQYVTKVIKHHDGALVYVLNESQPIEVREDVEYIMENME